MSIARRIRAAAVFATLWAIVWAVTAVVMGILLVTVKGRPVLELGFSWWSMAQGFATVGAMVGSLSGAVFSIALIGSSRADAVDSLSTRRMGMIGGIAGAALPLSILVLTTVFSGGTGIIAAALVAGVGAVVGSGLAVGSLALARQAPPVRGELPGSDPAGRLGSGVPD